MKLEWIEDILAISESRSLTEAAARRHVTQPAFSRRIRAIEEHLGVPLVDRSCRPARPVRAVTDAADMFRDLAARLRQVPGRLASSTRLVIACQHALSISIAPELAERVLRHQPEATVHLRSANRDDCLALLMTQQAHMMVTYETDDLPVVADSQFVEKKQLARERLIPVAAPGSAAAGWCDDPRRELAVIGYPDDVFLGLAMARNVLPSLSSKVRYRRVIETALTLAARELARAGLGAAWLPNSLARQDLASGRLIVLPEALGTCEMSLVALRLRGPRAEAEENAWRAAADPAASAAGPV